MRWPRLYLYSEVEHQAVWVSLCQLVEEVSPCSVCDHLLQPSWSLKTPPQFYSSRRDQERRSGFVFKISPLPQQWKWNQLSEGQSALWGDSWGDFPLAPGPEQALHLQPDKDRLLSSSGADGDFWHNYMNDESRNLKRDPCCSSTHVPIWMSHSASRLTVWATAE